MPTRILVVDDSPTIRTVVSTILERHGYEPKVATDGQDAYEALASGEVKADLVLVDFVMPRMNGYQFCRALRENTELSTTPVVLMSAKGDRIRDQFVEQTGALDAITKPFDAQALVAVIENALRKVNTHRASSARLPELEGDDVTGVGRPSNFLTPGATQPPAPVEYETKRTHVAQIVAQKLASIAARTTVERPELGGTALTAAIAEKLSNEAILEMMEAIGDLNRRERDKSLLSGDLGVVPIGAVLQLLQAENQTGVLVCTSGGAEVRATFRNGLIDLVQSTGAGDEFRLGRFFIEEGVLSPSEIEEITQKTAAMAKLEAPIVIEAPSPLAGASALTATSDEAPKSAIQIRESDSPKPASPSQIPSSNDPAPNTLPWGQRISAVPSTVRDDVHGMITLPGNAVADVLAAVTAQQKPRPLGTALLAAGKIVESQLRTALTKQSSELLYEVLRWHIGRFELRREAPSELAESARLGMPVASAVMEGFRRVDEWRVLERTLGSFDNVLVRDDAAFGALDIQSLPMREKAVLDAVDGDRTIRAIVSASHLSSFDVCRILVQFLEARVLRRRAA